MRVQAAGMDSSKRDLRGSFVDFSMHNVLAKEGILISGVVLYVVETMHSVLIKEVSSFQR